MIKDKSIVERVTKHFGSAYKAAKALDVSTQLYYKWVWDDKIPFKRGLEIEKATNGAITASEVYEAAAKAFK